MYTYFDINFCVATTLLPPKLAADCYAQWDKILSECVFHFYCVEIVRFKFFSSSALYSAESFLVNLQWHLILFNLTLILIRFDLTS